MSKSPPKQNKLITCQSQVMQKSRKSTFLNTLDFMKWLQSLKNNLVWTKCSSITLVSENIWVSVCILPVCCNIWSRIAQSQLCIEVTFGPTT